MCRKLLAGKNKKNESQCKTSALQNVVFFIFKVGLPGNIFTSAGGRYEHSSSVIQKVKYSGEP